MSNTPYQTPATAPDDEAADALLHLRPQLSHAAAHPLCPGALRVALPLLDAVLVGHARQLGELREEVDRLRGLVGSLPAGFRG